MEYLLSKTKGNGRQGCTYDTCGFGLEIPGRTLGFKGWHITALDPADVITGCQTMGWRLAERVHNGGYMDT